MTSSPREPLLIACACTGNGEVSAVWALLQTGPRRFERVDVPELASAELREGEVLLRTLAVGICGSDLPDYRGFGRPPTPSERPASTHAIRPGQPAHEIVGEVIASRHPDVLTGTRVVGWATGFDALREYVVTRGDEVNNYDADLDPATAVLLQPLACVLYALEQVPDPAGEHAAVLGLGPIGALFTHALKAAGAARVTGVDPVDRTGEAARFGIDDAVLTDSGHWAVGLADADRPAIVIESVGHQVSTLRHAIDALAPGGTVYYFGLPDDPVYPIPMRLFLEKNLTLHSGGTRERRRMLAAADTYLKAHPDLREGYITDIFAIKDARAGFELASVPAPGRLKVVLRA